MIDKEKISHIKNILSVHNKTPNLEVIEKLLTAVKDDDELYFYTTLLNLLYKDIDITLLENVLKTIKHQPNYRSDIYDSFSNNQIASKKALFKAIDLLNILDKDSTVVIWGCWYGSLLFPYLAPRVKKVLGLDLDQKTVQIGKKKIFPNYENVEVQTCDVFEKYLDIYKTTNLIINTSCEHMPPMKEWKWFGPGAIWQDSFKGEKGEGFKTPKLSSNCWFAVQSNNMFGIEGHINCVNSLEEFKSQMPERADIRFADEVTDTRGTRYMLVGKFMPL